MLTFFLDDFDFDFLDDRREMENGTVAPLDGLLDSIRMNRSNGTDACAYSTLDQPPVRAAFIFAYLFVFGCCCGGNFLLLIVVGVHPTMRTVTNFFLANLAAADLLVALFCVVQNLMHLFLLQALWPLGAFMCNMYVFVIHLIPCTSAGLLLVLSCERYIAIMHPIAARRLLTKGRLAFTTGVVWTISVITNVPYYIAADYREHHQMVNVSVGTNGTQFVMVGKPVLAWCGRADRGIEQRIMVTFSFVVWYVLPFMAMLVIYSIIGVTLWRSTGHDSVALTSASSGAGCSQSCGGRMVKRRSQGESGIPASRQMSSSGVSRLESPGKFEQETEMLSLSPSPDEVWRKKSSVDESQRAKGDIGGRRNLAVGNKSMNGRSHQNSLSGGADPREAIESRKRVIRLLISIILAFAILTLPNHLRLLLNAWNPPMRRCNHGFQALVQPLSYLLLFSNSGINPILYAFMSKKFRRAVGEMFSRKALRDQRRERFLTSIRSTATSDVYTTNTEY